MNLESLERVKSIVRRKVPSSFDIESLSLDILLESWTNAIDTPSWRFIQQRCIDALRSANTERRALIEHERLRSSQRDHTMSAEKNDSVQRLMSILDNRERRVIYYRFYAELSIEETAKRMKLDVNLVSQTLTTAIFKMKQEAWSGTER